MIFSKSSRAASVSLVEALGDVITFVLAALSAN